MVHTRVHTREWGEEECFSPPGGSEMSDLPDLAISEDDDADSDGSSASAKTSFGDSFQGTSNDEGTDIDEGLDCGCSEGILEIATEGSALP